MNIPYVIKLATAFVVIVVSSHANRFSEEIFSVVTVGASYPVMSANSFNDSAYDIDPNAPEDTGNGGAWNSSWNQNFVPSIHFLDYGNQKTSGSNRTTYVGPKVYIGQTRDYWPGSAGVHHANGNGYRIRSNSVTSAHIGTPQVGTPAIGVEGEEGYVPASADYQEATGNGGNDLLTRAIFMFDAGSQTGVAQVGTPADGDTPQSADYRPATPNYVAPITLEAGDSWEFRRNDNIYAQLVAPSNMGSAGNGDQNRSSLATYRPVVMANNEYYAGTLHAVDLDAFATDGNGNDTRVFNITLDASTTMWTKMENIVATSTWYHNDARGGPTNLIVDTSAPVTAAVDTTSTPGIIKSFTAGATTVAGSTLTNIQRVGFLLVSAASQHQGGYNFGVRRFSANATRASRVDTAISIIPWSQDFDPAVTLHTSPTGLDWGDWHVDGNGLTDPAAVNSTITLEPTLNYPVLQAEKLGTANASSVSLNAIGYGTVEPRLTNPDDYEATYVFDLIDFRDGQADITIRSRGSDGYVQALISPGGRVKFTHWFANYRHTNFDDFNGPSKFRKTNDPTSSNNGIRITSGGTFDPASPDSVEIEISAPVDSEGTPIVGGVTATASVTMNGDNTAVESVTIEEVGYGYVDEPTVTFSGGGMTVSPEFTFNFETGDSQTLAPGKTGDNGTSTSTVINKNLPDNGNVFNDENQTLTIVQSYNSATDSITYYYGTGSDPVNNVMFAVNPADHSAGGYGFHDVISGNPGATVPNDKAISITFAQWGAHSENSDQVGTPASGVEGEEGYVPASEDYAPAVTGNYAQVGFKSYALEFGTGIDGDGDGYLDRLDVFPTIPTEWIDTDGDNIGDNSDEHRGRNDGDINNALGIVSQDGKINLSAWLTTNNYVVDDGGPSLGVYNAVVTERDNALAAQATAEAARNTAQTAQADAEAARDTAQLALANAREARPGSTVIDVANDLADITLRVEQTSDVSDWSNPTTSDHTIQLSAPAGASFYRFTIPE